MFFVRFFFRSTFPFHFIPNTYHKYYSLSQIQILMYTFRRSCMPKLLTMLVNSGRQSISTSTNSLQAKTNKLTTFTPKYYDVGMNLSDEMFQGVYRDKKVHKEDVEDVLKRAKFCNVTQMLLTGSSLRESRWTLEQARKYNDQQLEDENGNRLYPNLLCTVGVHPCTVMEFESDPEKHISLLRDLIQKYRPRGLVRAIGEIGLDYDRLHFTPADRQRQYFEMQLKLAAEFDLPLFLHMRNACDDFLRILVPFVDGSRKDGVQLKNKNCLIHSFSGSEEDLRKILAHETFWVSVNGCSLKTEENCKVAAQIPLDRLLIETDAPWCEIKRSHASYRYLTKCPNTFYPIEYNPQNVKIGRTQPGKLHPFLPIPVVKPHNLDDFPLRDSFVQKPLVKARNEPCMFGFVAEVMAALKHCDSQTLIDKCYQNSVWLFG